jgi:exosome complex RNA-binding protein Rrp42 (RNase PH superfamily)
LILDSTEEVKWMNNINGERHEAMTGTTELCTITGEEARKVWSDIDLIDTTGNSIYLNI